MSISGSCFSKRPWEKASYSFTYCPDPWGWASWRRAWRAYDAEMSSWPHEMHLLRERLKDDSSTIEYWSRIFDLTTAGKVDTWDYQWFWSVIRRNGLCITPHMNFVRNIGLGPDATHTKDPNSNLGNRSVEGFSGRLAHPRQIRRNYSIERDLAVSRFRIPRRALHEQIEGRLRSSFLRLTTYNLKPS
jgi:hypothetical protein